MFNLKNSVFEFEFIEFIEQQSSKLSLLDEMMHQVQTKKTKRARTNFLLS